MQQGPTDSSFLSGLMHSLQNIFSFAVQSYLLKRGGGAGWLVWSQQFTGGVVQQKSSRCGAENRNIN